MLDEPLRDRQDAARHLQTGGIRVSRKRAVQLAKAGGRHRTVPSRHGLERRIELRAQIQAASDAAQLDGLGTYRKRRHELCALKWCRRVRHCEEAAIHAALPIGWIPGDRADGETPADHAKSASSGGASGRRATAAAAAETKAPRCPGLRRSPTPCCRTG